MSLIFLLRVALFLIQAATLALALAVFYLLGRYAAFGAGMRSPGSQISRKDKDARGNKLSPDEKARASRLRKWDRRVKTGTGAKQLEKETLKQIKGVASRLFSPELYRDRDIGEISPEGRKGDPERTKREEARTGIGVIIKETERLLKKSKKRGLTKQSNQYNFGMEEIAAACFLAACKKHHRPVLRAEVREEMGLEKKKFKNAHKLLCSELDLSLYNFRAVELVGRILSRLDIKDRGMKMEAKKWCSRVKEHLGGACTRRKIAAISVLIAYNQITNQRMKWSAVADAGDLDIQTVRRGVKKIGPGTLIFDILNRRDRRTEKQTSTATIPGETQRIVETTIPGETRSSVEATIA